MVHCAVWKLSVIPQWKKFVNDTFSCKVGAWKFLRKISIVISIVISSRLLATKGIECMSYFSTCSQILLLWRSHHLCRNKCAALTLLWSNGSCFPFPCFEPYEEITERVVETSSFGNSGLEFSMSLGPNAPTASIDGRSHRYLVGYWPRDSFCCCAFMARCPSPFLLHNLIPSNLGPSQCICPTQIRGS